MIRPSAREITEIDRLNSGTEQRGGHLSLNEDIRCTYFFIEKIQARGERTRERVWADFYCILPECVLVIERELISTHSRVTRGDKKRRSVCVQQERERVCERERVARRKFHEEKEVSKILLALLECLSMLSVK